MKTIQLGKDLAPDRLTTHERLEELQSYAKNVEERVGVAHAALFGPVPSAGSSDAQPTARLFIMEECIRSTRTSLERIAADMDAIVNALYVR